MCHNQSEVFYLCLILTLLLTTNICGSQSQSQSETTNCAKFGEYCQTHWECCSRSCHSYLMRCTRGEAIYPYDFFGISPIMPHNAVQSTLDDILQINFGDGSHILNNNIQSSPTEESNVNSGIPKRKPINSPSMNEGRDGEVDRASKQREQRSSQEVIFRSTQHMNSSGGCKTMPSKCYQHDECCTKRCHQFLHQCVT